MTLRVGERQSRALGAHRGSFSLRSLVLRLGELERTSLKSVFWNLEFLGIYDP